MLASVVGFALDFLLFVMFLQLGLGYRKCFDLLTINEIHNFFEFSSILLTTQLTSKTFSPIHYFPLFRRYSLTEKLFPSD
jgi:hypothetical protein